MADQQQSPESVHDARINARHAAARNRAICTAAEFAEAVRAWSRRGGAPPGPRLVRRIEPEDVIDLRGLRCDRRLDLSGFYFEVPVDLRDARIDGPLLAADAVFEFGLHLGGSRIVGALDASGADFERPDAAVGRILQKQDDPGGNSVLDLNHASVRGDVILSGARVALTVNLNCARVRGDIFAHGIRVDSHVDLRDAVVEGSFYCSGRAAGPSRVGTLLLTAARLRGSLRLEDFHGELLCDGLEAEAVSLVRVRAAALGLQRGRMRGDIALVSTAVEGSADLRNSEADELIVNGCTFGGDLTLMAGRVRRFAWLCPHGDTATSITGSLEAYGLSVRVNMLLAGVRVGGKLDLRNTHLGGLDVAPSLVERQGHFELAHGEVGRLDARGARIDGNVTCVARVQEDIDFSNGEVQGDLCLAVRELDGRDGAARRPLWFDWIHRNASVSGFTVEPQLEQIAGGRDVRTEAGAILLRLLTCNGDADLRGVAIRGRGAGGEPTLDATDATVKGSLLLCDPRTGGDGSGGGRLRVVDGRVRLAGAGLGHLRISGESFLADGLQDTGGDRDWTWVDAAVAAVGLVAVAAWAGCLLAVLAGADIGGLLDPSSAGNLLPAWKHAGVATILAVLGFVCYRAARRVLRITIVADDRPGRPRLRRRSVPASAEHAVVALHGVGSRELGLSCLQAGVRLLLAVACAAMLAVPFLQADTSPFAMRVPLLALAALLVRGYARVLLAACHSRSCAAAWSTRRAEPPHAWPARVLVAATRGLKNFAVTFLACDAWLMLAFALAMHFVSTGWPATVAEHAFPIGFAVLVVPLIGPPLARWLQLRARRSMGSQRPENAPPGPSPTGPNGTGSAPAASPTAPAAEDDGPAPRRAIAGLGLRVMSFRDLMQVVTLNVVAPGRRPAQRPSLDLDRARIGELEILKPIPRYVALSNLAVERWRIDGEDDALNTLEVLDHAAEFKADVYQKVSDTLRNGGQRADAEVVYRAARRQARWRETRWVRTVLSLGHGLIGYGTHRGPLLALMALWFLFTATWFAAEYDQVLGPGPAYAIDALQIGRCDALAQVFDAAECKALTAAARRPLTRPDTVSRVARALAVAIRYHVPIIPWDMWPYDQPKNNLVWGYTAFVTAAHWIIWPLLLASLIPALLPRGDG